MWLGSKPETCVDSHRELRDFFLLSGISLTFSSLLFLVLFKKPEFFLELRQTRANQKRSSKWQDRSKQQGFVRHSSDRGVPSPASPGQGDRLSQRLRSLVRHRHQRCHCSSRLQLLTWSMPGRGGTRRVFPLLSSSQRTLSWFSGRKRGFLLSSCCVSSRILDCPQGKPEEE